MKFLATLSAAAIVALAAAIPVPEEAANIPAPFDMELPTDLPTANDGAVLEYQGETISKRSVEKRADTTIDVWSGKSKGGRHETLHTDYNKCYNLGNGWNDDIESVTVYPGTGCVFYNKNNCNTNSGDSGGLRFTVSTTATVGQHVADMEKINNMVSSYLCFRM